MTFRITIILLLSSILLFSQKDEETIRAKVLQYNVIDSSYVFGKWDEMSGTETHLKYLGSIKTKSNGILKVLISTWIWGYSKRATNRILIYDMNNCYLGNYYVDVKKDLPIKIENSVLIFQSKLTFEFNGQIPDYIVTDRGLVFFERF